MKSPVSLAAIAAACIATPALAQTAPPADWMTAPRDWGQTLREDATALHTLIIENHPGVHDRMNPDFRKQADESLALTLSRADTTTDAGGWWWALRALVASFDDGHVQIGLSAGSGFPTRWPGFLTVYRGDAQIVAARDDAVDAPPIGARLIDCDGKPADRLAAERIGAFRGRWSLEAQRATLGDWQFQNASNPWISEMTACRFEVNGQTRTWTLDWRDISTDAMRGYRTPLAQGRAAAFGLTALDDGGFWLSMPSFNGNPGSEAHTALTPLMAELATRQAELRTAPYVVLDLRGNGGGSSHWSAEIAKVLWGEDWGKAHQPAEIESIDWRASPDNLKAIQSYVDEWTAAGESAGRIAWAQEIVDGMTAAMAAGEPYWVDVNQPEETDATGAAAPPRLPHGRIYVLTDPICASACLDAVDLWKAMDAIQIGRETSADTVYMDVRNAELPSGLARLVIPMKVWRGRPRGNNEPQRPVHVFEDDMSDTAALRDWVRTMDRSGWIRTPD